jgi:FkbM family methyltransferase
MMMAVRLWRWLLSQRPETASDPAIVAQTATVQTEPGERGMADQASAFVTDLSPLQIYRGYDEHDIPVLRQFAASGVRPEPGFVLDFLGVRTRIASLYDAVRDLDGVVLGIPVPGDYHAEAIEWIGAMKSVRSANGRYAAMEWGAGWAPWLVATGKAARNAGISSISLYGVEADPMHFAAMKQHFSDNGFPPAEHVLLQAAIGVECGRARWPRELDARNQWGGRPVRDESTNDVAYLNNRVDSFIDVEVVAARELLLREPRWDMVHIDIQGWEAEVCRSCMDLLGERVRWLIIGVHSRVLDAALLEMFHAGAWTLEHEKPTRFQYQRGLTSIEAMTVADGTQVWRNLSLLPA